MNLKEELHDGDLMFLEDEIAENLAIPDDVKAVAERAFKQLRTLRDLVIPHPRQIIEMTSSMGHYGVFLVVRCNDHTMWYRYNNRWNRMEPIPQGD